MRIGTVKMEENSWYFLPTIIGYKNYLILAFGVWGIVIQWN